MIYYFALLVALTATVSTFPFILDMPGVDASLITKGSSEAHVKRQSTCPFNPNHLGAAPYSSAFPYLGAKNGLPGTGQGGIKVPADGGWLPIPSPCPH